MTPKSSFKRLEQLPHAMSTFKQLASLLGISDRQLRRYAEEGKITGVYTTKGGHWRLRGALTPGRVERARKVLRLNPGIAASRKRELLKRTNTVIKDVQKQWRHTFEPSRKKQTKISQVMPAVRAPKPEEIVQGDLFSQW
jgi:excisionase family DNA binding protein